MIIKHIFYIFLIFSFCLTNEFSKRDGAIDTNQELKDKDKSKSNQLRNLLNSEGTGLFIMIIKWCSYLCFVIFALWLFAVFVNYCADDTTKAKNNRKVPEFTTLIKLKAIYLFMRSDY